MALVINRRTLPCCCCSIACYWILLWYAPIASRNAAAIATPQRHGPKLSFKFPYFESKAELPARFSSSPFSTTHRTEAPKVLPFHYVQSQTWPISSTLSNLHSNLPRRNADAFRISYEPTPFTRMGNANRTLTWPLAALTNRKLQPCCWRKCSFQLGSRDQVVHPIRGRRRSRPRQKCRTCRVVFRLHCAVEDRVPYYYHPLPPVFTYPTTFPATLQTATASALSSPPILPFQQQQHKHKRDVAMQATQGEVGVIEPGKSAPAPIAAGSSSNLLPAAGAAAGNNKIYGTATRSHSPHRAHITGPAFELAEMGMGNLSEAVNASDPYANATFTFPVSSAALLPCSVRQLGNQTVSWLRRLRGDLLLLTVGKVAYTGDARLAVLFKYPGSWTLRIQSLSLDDNGLYECQINSHPPRTWVVRLQVSGPEVQISDVYGQKIAEQFYKVGSTVKVCCRVRQAQPMPYTVFWTRGKTILNYDTTRGGVSVVTDKQGDNATSCLTLSKVKLNDSGQYQCRAQDSLATVQVHIDDGAEPAAVHDNARGSSLCQWHIWLMSMLALTTIWLWQIKS